VTREVPKPLLEIAGRPILQHVMEIYARQGHTRFVLAAGFKASMVAEFAATLSSEWDVTVVDTGEDTDKGDRVVRCKDLLPGTFFVTYSDGVGDVDLEALLRFHCAHKGGATVTVVPLPSPYGTIDHDGSGRVRDFQEKPRLRDHWINAGFFAMEPDVFDHWLGPDLEGDVLPALAAAGKLYAFRHEGFWKSMDTYKDSQDLDEIARRAESREGQPPWLT
jgi:glucose-1-phosphate cytidylyltransferase